MTRKLYLAYHTISLSFCVGSETVVPAAERLLSILKSRCSDSGKCMLSGVLISSRFLVAAFPVRFEVTLGLWRGVSLEEPRESVKERSASADEPKVNQ
jgi:hypothetical protein